MGKLVMNELVDCVFGCSQRRVLNRNPRVGEGASSVNLIPVSVVDPIAGTPWMTVPGPFPQQAEEILVCRVPNLPDIIGAAVIIAPSADDRVQLGDKGRRWRVSSMLDNLLQL